MRPICLRMIFLLFTLLYLIIWLKIILKILLNEPSREKVLLTLHVMTENSFVTPEKSKEYHARSCQNVCEALTFLLDNIFCKIEWNCFVPSKVIDRNQKCSQNLSSKGPKFSPNLAGYTHFRKRPVFKDAWPLCEVWMKLMCPFKGYRSETKSVTTRTTMTTTETSSLCVNQASQETQKGHNSVKIMEMTSKFEHDMYLMIHYPSVKIQ